VYEDAKHTREADSWFESDLDDRWVNADPQIRISGAPPIAAAPHNR
jgi:hypothetical protein